MLNQAYHSQNNAALDHPEWSRNAAIYQVNTRQFTAEGTIAAAERELPRLHDLGVTIVYLMPIHPIGDVNRKGSLGSPYAVKDYLAVDPALGSLADLKQFVATAHSLGLFVIIDWVANHTAWDNPLTLEHPEWYMRDYKGEFCPTPWWDWTDIIDLDYGQAELRRYMTDALIYWVEEADIDGYRCDVAGFVPIDFWNNARRELEQIKPVFMLAEAEERDLHTHAFDVGYGWSWYDAVSSITNGSATVDALASYYANSEKGYPRDAYRMLFVSNHDKNAWDGTEFEVFGDGVEAAVVLSVVSAGMPLIYNGQEAGNRKRLEFFERDPIGWREHSMGALYKKLFALKKQNTALWNGTAGAPMIRVPNDSQQQVLSFVRRDSENKVFAVFNLSDEPMQVQFEESLYKGDYVELFSGDAVKLDAESVMPLSAWDYKVFIAESLK